MTPERRRRWVDRLLGWLFTLACMAWVVLVVGLMVFTETQPCLGAGPDFIRFIALFVCSPALLARGPLHLGLFAALWLLPFSLAFLAWRSRRKVARGDSKAGRATYIQDQSE